MDRAKELIDFFGIVVAFERNQAIADHLQMLFGFRLEEFQYFVRHFFVRGERVKIGARRGRYDSFVSKGLGRSPRRTETEDSSAAAAPSGTQNDSAP